MPVKEVKRILYVSYQYIKWKWQIFQRKEKIFSGKEASFAGQRNLYVIPHADDELIGGFSTIIKNRSDFLLFYCGMLGTNPKEENKRTRLREFISLCKSERISYVIADGNLEKHISRAIYEYNPANIFIPSIVDWHEEHRLLNKILLKVLDNQKQSIHIVWYQISVPIPINYINSYTPQKYGDVKYKWDKFRMFYHSQSHMPIQRFLLESRFGGKKTKNYAIEPFVVLEEKEWKSKVENLDLYDEQLIQLKLRINNLQDVYRESEKIYFSLFLQK